MLRVFNTLTRKTEDFVPIDANHVKMYACGPTVYTRPHLGNMRSVVVYDVMYRYLKSKYPKVTYARNITDIDDKIINAAKNSNINYTELAHKVTEMFYEDCKYLGCLSPSIEPKVTNEIEAIVDLIDKIIANGFAYIKENHVLFSVEKYQQYGELSNRKLEDLIGGSRVAVESYKKHPGDFVLWKPSGADEPGWKTKFGYGRPGWHIECSAMASKYLGENFDIHGGGADLQFPHHENEMAQSKCGNLGSVFAKYWLHNGFLTSNGEKMSKSLGNFVTCEDLRKKKISGETIRLALLSAGYRKPIDFSDHLIESTSSAISKLYKAIEDADTSQKVPDEAMKCLEDDFNTSKYLAIMFSYLKDIRDTKHLESRTKIAGQLYAMGRLIGIFEQQNSCSPDHDIPENINQLCAQRESAKANKEYTKADSIRKEIGDLGYSIKDTKNGPVITKIA